jgi:serine/threonine protein kinase
MTVVNDLAGRRLGQYQLREVIRRGGMSTVYLGYQPSLDRLVAVKVLAFPGDPEFAARFEREARSIAALQHPNILAVYDYGEQDDQAYLVVQYVEDGRTLVDLLRTPQPPDRCLELMERVLAGLGYAHERGIVHRDVKPSNILLASPSWPMLADFGIAKLLLESDREPITRQGFIVGTASYMAPEQGFGFPVDARTDLYSAGVVLYEMLTGRVPFKADTPMAALVAQAYEPPPPLQEVNPDLPGELEAVVLRALAKDPAERYQSAEEMAEALRVVRAELQELRQRPAGPGIPVPGALPGAGGGPATGAPGGAEPVTPPSRPRPSGPSPTGTRRPPVTSSAPPISQRRRSARPAGQPPDQPAAPPGPGEPAGGRLAERQADAVTPPSRRLPAGPPPAAALVHVPPSVPAVIPPAAAAASRRGRVAVTVVSVVVAAGLLAGAALWGIDRLKQPKGQGGQGVLLLRAGDLGPAPFLGTPASTSNQPVFTPAQQLQIKSQPGTVPLLYAGSRGTAPPGCSRIALARVLRADPLRADAWTAALNRDPALSWSQGSKVTRDQIEAFLGELTPVLLRTDTRFIDVGYAGGRAVDHQALFEQGTGVLIDQRGMPRVRCGSGDVLLRPTAAVQRYLGTRWQGFSIGTVQAIQPGNTQRVFKVADVGTGQPFFRPAGSNGSADSPAG